MKYMNICLELIFIYTKIDVYTYLQRLMSNSLDDNPEINFNGYEYIIYYCFMNNQTLPFHCYTGRKFTESSY